MKKDTLIAVGLTAAVVGGAAYFAPEEAPVVETPAPIATYPITAPTTTDEVTETVTEVVLTDDEIARRCANLVLYGMTFDPAYSRCEELAE